MNAQCRKVLQDGESSKKRRKKGPGISRVEPSGTRKAQQQQSRFRSLREDELQGPPSRTRASLRRRHYEPSSTKLKVEKKLNQEDQSTNGVIEEPLGVPPITQPLPDKQTLELIIDTLQRKDIYEIFAEPVDPEEVEDYYEIIEEPMDFGTMRAKLHEGLYASLEQFEAHGIHKLAKRVFHVLRTNPENFESEFSGSRRRSCRRSQDETNEFNGKLFLKTSEKTSTATIDAYLKNTNSLIHRSFLENPRIARGSGDNKRSHPIEVDRRSTYKPDLDLNNDNWSKSLIHLNQQEHSYSQSLMQFVKDLGPTAQMIAKRKLQNLIVDHQPTIRDLGKQPQITTSQMWFNSSRSAAMNPIDRDLSVNGIDRDESNSNRHGMARSYSGGRMDSVVTSASLPAWLRQEPCNSRFALNLGFLKSKLGNMNESEKTSCSSNKQFDPSDLTLQL
ncbi:hypothetical protein L1987_21731 [Smallanthus sonchifolius]|uniref:Uncharacterized protein n=1 Tax=Smallanthus sonchifolius TaxID=185202 RepID=A0ACB9ICX1_9ASTR|nr:hypothetical protein L1987_21731 [Smallanthus sonchifolius]